MNVGEAIDHYRIFDRYPVEPHLFVRFGNCLIKILANNKTVVDELTSYFQEFVVSSGLADITISVHEAPEFVTMENFIVKQPDPGKTKIKEEYVDLDDGRIVHKRLTGMIFIFGRGNHIAIGPCLGNLNQVVNFINNRYIEWLLCRGCLLGHAAAVAWRNKGLALSGFSGAGKSTLALRLMEKGLNFISNDRLMVENTEEGMTLHGVAKLPRINPGTALNSESLAHLVPEDDKKRFAALPLKELWQVENKYDVPIDTCYGPKRFILDAKMIGLVVLDWKPQNGKLIVERITDGDRRKALLAAFIKETGLFFLPAGDCRMPVPTVDNYQQLLADVDMWAFTGGADFDKAADTCLSFLLKND